MLISIDKKIIAANAKGCVQCDYITNSTSTTSEEISGCWNLDHDECYTTEKWVEKYQEGDVIKSGLFSHLGDTGGGVLSLFISLGILCIALYKIVSTLHRIILQGRGRGKILDVIVNVLTKNGLASILFGMLLTISVQSSSITTSTFTPLVGLSIISLEQMLPLTLGANLGTTWSASLFASIFNSDRKLLTFSDSVQDAAHRAGFIAARAYRTSFRTALTNFVNINGSQRLDQFHENFINYSMF